jgi:hypothetical protein
MSGFVHLSASFEGYAIAEALLRFSGATDWMTQVPYISQHFPIVELEKLAMRIRAQK